MEEATSQALLNAGLCKQHFSSEAILTYLVTKANEINIIFIYVGTRIQERISRAVVAECT